MYILELIAETNKTYYKVKLMYIWWYVLSLLLSKEA